MPVACKKGQNLFFLYSNNFTVLPTYRPYYKQREQGGFGLEKLAQDSPVVKKGLIHFILPADCNVLGSHVRRKGFLTLLCRCRRRWSSSAEEIDVLAINICGEKEEATILQSISYHVLPHVCISIGSLSL